MPKTPKTIKTDPTGLTAATACKEARSRFGGDWIAHAASCGGWFIRNGNPCCHGGRAHLQPCPGTVVYDIVRCYVSPDLGPMQVSEARGASWREAIDAIAARREADRAFFCQPKARTASRKQSR